MDSPGKYEYSGTLLSKFRMGDVVSLLFCISYCDNGLNVYLLKSYPIE